MTAQVIDLRARFTARRIPRLSDEAIARRARLEARKYCVSHSEGRCVDVALAARRMGGTDAEAIEAARQEALRLAWTPGGDAA